MHLAFGCNQFIYWSLRRDCKVHGILKFCRVVIKVRVNEIALKMLTPISFQITESDVWILSVTGCSMRFTFIFRFHINLVRRAFYETNNYEPCNALSRWLKVMGRSMSWQTKWNQRIDSNFKDPFSEALVGQGREARPLKVLESFSEGGDRSVRHKGYSRSVLALGWQGRMYSSHSLHRPEWLQIRFGDPLLARECI